jgi:membrane protease YdiL (CAAX protease family)
MPLPLTLLPQFRAPFGAPAAEARRGEWKRLGLFLGIGAAIFLLAIVATGFVPFSWPDAIRRSTHPMVFVPLAIVLNARLLRRDAIELGSAALFDPWPIGRATLPWLVLGILLAGMTTLVFVLAFGMRWAPNPRWSGANMILSIWAIVFTAAAEEIAFRGYALWRLLRLIGLWPAQLIVAAFFALSHLTLGGYTLLPALIGTVTGSILYGAAFTRTRGIAAPIALHSGWNIAQHLVLSPLDASATPLVPVFVPLPTPSIYAAMVSTVGIVMVAAAFAVLTLPRRTLSTGR